jgi:8-oxo-dGTP pyrophosphatase MutT (NUDIX family)
MKRDFGIYQVALKILLRKGNKVLLLKTDDGKYWDLPGGRIDTVENKTPLKKILAREIREELGQGVRYELGRPLFQYRRRFKERNIYIFQTVYAAAYLGGNIKISPEHTSYAWIDPKKFVFRQKDFPSKEEYLAYKEEIQSNDIASR